SEEHTSELQSLTNLVCRLLLEKKKQHPHQTAQFGRCNQRAHASGTTQSRPRVVVQHTNYKNRAPAHAGQNGGRPRHCERCYTPSASHGRPDTFPTLIPGRSNVSSTMRADYSPVAKPSFLPPSYILSASSASTLTALCFFFFF